MTVAVTLLTKPACDLCDQAKKTLDQVSHDFDIDIAVVGFDSDEGQALAAAAGIFFPPGVILDGRPFSYGRLSERKLRRALRQLPGDRAQPSAG